MPQTNINSVQERNIVKYSCLYTRGRKFYERIYFCSHVRIYVIEEEIGRGREDGSGSKKLLCNARKTSFIHNRAHIAINYIGVACHATLGHENTESSSVCIYMCERNRERVLHNFSLSKCFCSVALLFLFPKGSIEFSLSCLSNNLHERRTERGK